MKLTYRLHLLFCFFSGFLLGFVIVHVPSQVAHAVDFLFGTDGNNNFIIKGRVAAGTPTPTPILIMGSGGAITNAQMSATNISSAAFGSNTGGGTYSFPGSVGIGMTGPGQKLSVAGTIESTSGGFKFPDGTTQSSATLTNTSTCLGSNYNFGAINTNYNILSLTLASGTWLLFGTSNDYNSGSGGSSVSTSINNGSTVAASAITSLNNGYQASATIVAIITQASSATWYLTANINVLPGGLLYNTYSGYPNATCLEAVKIG